MKWKRSRSSGKTGSHMVARVRKLMLVEWIDSHSGNGWQPLDAIAESSEPVYCRSVGWLVSDRNGTVVLASSISGERNGNLRLYGKGDIAIPKRAIVKQSPLRGG